MNMDNVLGYLKNPFSGILVFASSLLAWIIGFFLSLLFLLIYTEYRGNETGKYMGHSDLLQYCFIGGLGVAGIYLLACNIYILYLAWKEKCFNLYALQFLSVAIGTGLLFYFSYKYIITENVIRL